MAKTLNIPERLEFILKERGISQNALARISGVSPQTVANTLRHGRLPQARTIDKFARTLGVPKSVFSKTAKLTETDLKAAVATGTPAAAATKAAASRGGSARPVAKATATAKAKAASSSKPGRKPGRPVGSGRKPGRPVGSGRKAAATAAPAKPSTTGKRRGRPPAAPGTTVGDQIWKRVNELIGDGSTAKAAFDVVARERKTTAGNVQHQFYRMKRKAGAGASGGRTIVRHATGAASRAGSSARGRASAARDRGVAAASSGVAAAGVDLELVIDRLEKLTKSRTEETALQACIALLDWARK